jgi:hypothetical protein
MGQPLTGLQCSLVSLESGVRVAEEAWSRRGVGDCLKGMERPETSAGLGE